MKFNVKKSITVDFTLDSSEAVMFSQGGMHSIKLARHEIVDEDDHYDYEMIFNFQMQRNAQGRFDFITKEAANAIHRREKEEKKDEN